MSVLRIYGCTIIIITIIQWVTHNTFGSAICRMSSSSFSCVIKTIFHFILCKITFCNRQHDHEHENNKHSVGSCQLPVAAHRAYLGELYPKCHIHSGHTVDKRKREWNQYLIDFNIQCKRINVCLLIVCSFCFEDRGHWLEEEKGLKELIRKWIVLL